MTHGGGGGGLGQMCVLCVAMFMLTLSLIMLLVTHRSCAGAAAGAANDIVMSKSRDITFAQHAIVVSNVIVSLLSLIHVTLVYRKHN